MKKHQSLYFGFIFVFFTFSFSLATPVDAQNSSPGVDILFIFEDTGRNLAPGQLDDPAKYEIVNYVAQMLADDAFFHNPGVEHRLGVITYNDDATNRIALADTTFGPYNDVEQSTFVVTPETEVNYRNDIADVHSKIDALPTRRSGEITSTAGLTGLAEMVNSELGSSQNRVQHVILVTVGRPQSNNPDRDAQITINALNNIISSGNRRLDVYALPNAINANFDVDLGMWQTARGSMSGIDASVESIGDLTLAIVPTLTETLDEFSTITDLATRDFDPIVHNAADSCGGEESCDFAFFVPSFTETMTVISVGDTPDNLSYIIGEASPLVSSEPYQQSHTDRVTVASPRPGEYTIQNARNVIVELRSSEVVLAEITSGSQLEPIDINVTFKDIFGDTIHYPGYSGDAVPALSVTINHIQDTPWVFSVPSNPNIRGSYDLAFIPPLPNNYDIKITESELNLNLSDTFDVSALEISFDNSSSELIIYREETLDFSVNNGGSIEIAPTLKLEFEGDDLEDLSEQRIALSRDNLTASVTRTYTQTTQENNATSVTASLEVSVTQPLSNEERPYTKLSEQNFPLVVRTPITTLSGIDEDILMRREMTITASLESGSTLTSDLLIQRNVRLCIMIEGNPPAEMSFSNNEFSYDFVPPTRGTYNFTIGTRVVCDEESALLTPFATNNFIARELALGFNTEGAAFPTLNQFVDYNGALQLYEVLDSGLIQPYSGIVSDPVNVTSLDATVGIQDQNNAFALTLIAPQTDAAQTYVFNTGDANLRFVYGATLRNDTEISLSVDPVTYTISLEPQSGDDLIQFATATLSVELASGDSFSADDFVGRERRVEATVAVDDQTFSVPLTLSDNAFVSDTPLPIGGEYNVTVTLYGQNGSEAAETLSTSNTAPFTVDKILLQPSPENPTNFPAETEKTFEFYWVRESATGTPLTISDFDNVPQVRFNIIRTGSEHVVKPVGVLEPVDNRYSFTYQSEAGIVASASGESFHIIPSWQTQSSDGNTIVIEGDPYNFTLGAVTAFYLTIDAPRVQNYYIPLMPFVNPNVRSTHELRFDIQAHEDANGDEVPDETNLPILGLYGDAINDKDNYSIFVKDLDNNSIDVSDDDWDILPGSEIAPPQLTLSGIPDNQTVQVSISLDASVMPLDTTQYIARSNDSFGVVETVLQLSALTFILPAIWIVASLVIAFLIWLGWFLMNFYKHTRSPYLVGYLRVEDASGDLWEWEENLASFNRNTIDLRNRDGFAISYIRRMKITKIENRQDSVHIDLWMSNTTNILGRMLGYFAPARFDPPKSQELDPGDQMPLPGSDRFILLADSAYGGHQEYVAPARTRSSSSGMNAGGREFTEVEIPEGKPERQTPKPKPASTPTPAIKSSETEETEPQTTVDTDASDTTGTTDTQSDETESSTSSGSMPFAQRRQRRRENPFKTSSTTRNDENDEE